MDDPEIEDARQALTHIVTTERDRWADWVRVGRGLLKCRTLALRHANSNDFTSHAAKMAMGAVLTETKLDAIDKGVRSDLLRLMDDLPSVEAWRGTLTEEQRTKLNHPRAVYRRWKAALAALVTANAADDAPAAVAPRAKKRDTMAELGAALEALEQANAELAILRAQLASALEEIAALRDERDAARHQERAADESFMLESLRAEPDPDAVRMADWPYCKYCGHKFEQTGRGRPKLYCSVECREAAAEQRAA